jgi:hypothetical protein
MELPLPAAARAPLAPNSLLSPRAQKPQFLVPQFQADEVVLAPPTRKLRPPAAPQAAKPLAAEPPGADPSAAELPAAEPSAAEPPAIAAPLSLADAAFFRFLRGRGLEGLIVSLRSARPSSSRFGYFCEEAWAERGAAPLPNPFSLLHTLMAAGDRSDVPARYMTVSQGGVTLWADGEARECHTLYEWHHAHASFERVAHAPVLRRFRKRYTLSRWKRMVQGQRSVRLRAALLRAQRTPEPDNHDQFDFANTVNAFVHAPLALMRRTCGWILSQELQPSQLTGASGPGQVPPVELGPLNGVALAAAIEEQLYFVTRALLSASDALQQSISKKEAQPLALVPEAGCRFLMEKYSPRLYPAIVGKHFNQAAELRGLRSPRDIHVWRPPMAPPLHGASLARLDTWIEESEPASLEHTAAQVRRQHLLVVGRVVRGADAGVMSAVLQLPLSALRAFRTHFKSLGWKRLTGNDAPPVLTLRIERTWASAAGVSQPLRLVSPSAKELVQMLLRRCVGCLQGLHLPSEAEAFAEALELHEQAMLGIPRPAKPATVVPPLPDWCSWWSLLHPSPRPGTSGEDDQESSGAAAADAEAERAAQAAWATFGKYDLDGGGTIDRKELQLALADLGLKVTKEELSTLLSKFGREGDLDMDTFATLVIGLNRHRQAAHAAAEAAAQAAAEAAAQAALVAAARNPFATFDEPPPTAVAAAATPAPALSSMAFLLKGDLAAAAAFSAAPAPRPNRRTLRECLTQYYFECPAPPVVAVLEELEMVLETALTRAEEAALRHPPFVAAAREGGVQHELSERAPTLRSLDVGCIRVDGAELWPAEDREVDLAPYFAPVSLNSLVLEFGGEGAIKVKEDAAQAAAEAAAQAPVSAADTLANLIAFAKNLQKAKELEQQKKEEAQAAAARRARDEEDEAREARLKAQQDKSRLRREAEAKEREEAERRQREAAAAKAAKEAAAAKERQALLAAGGTLSKALFAQSRSGEAT